MSNKPATELHFISVLALLYLVTHNIDCLPTPMPFFTVVPYHHAESVHEDSLATGLDVVDSFTLVPSHSVAQLKPRFELGILCLSFFRLRRWELEFVYVGAEGYHDLVELLLTMGVQEFRPELIEKYIGSFFVLQKLNALR